MVDCRHTGRSRNYSDAPRTQSASISEACDVHLYTQQWHKQNSSSQPAINISMLQKYLLKLTKYRM